MNSYFCLFSVHVLRDNELPLEVASALGPEVQFVLKYIDGKYIHIIILCRDVDILIRLDDLFDYR